MKTCSRCKEEKDFEDFPGGGPNGSLYSWCRACVRVRNAERHRLRKADPEAQARKRISTKKSYLKVTYGLTSDDYYAMLDSQGYACAICGIDEDDAPRKSKNTVDTLDIDHSHATGRVRALLCFNCNAMLGSARDNVDILQAGIDYLNKHRGE